MRSQITLPITLLRAFTNHLLERGFEIEESVANWRVLMYRKDSPQWTQGYYGKTRSGLHFRNFIRFAGPEASVASNFKENYDGPLF